MSKRNYLVMSIVKLSLTVSAFVATINTFVVAEIKKGLDCHDDGTCVTGSGASSTSKTRINLNDTPCSLYIAESSIPNSGLGVYTGKKIKRRERVFVGDLAIHLEDPDINAHLRRSRYNSNERPGIINSYVWAPSNTLGEFEAEQAQSLTPGIGMLGNAHTGLMNVELRFPFQTYDLHRYKHASAGAVTTYHDTHFIASNRSNIQAGSELFLTYGDEWFEARTSIGMIPLSTDFQRADEVIQSISDIPEVKENNELATKLLQLMSETASMEPRLQAAIPRTLPEFQRALKSGTASLSVPKRVRPIKWLETHGQCVDNITPDQSTIQFAGYGAFATRSLMQGQVVAPLPLMQLQRQYLDVYHSTNYRDPSSKVQYAGKQLMLNYVYGHPKSSLLFVAYSPVVNYINHGNASEANVELRWSSLKPNRNRDLLSKMAEEVVVDKQGGLIMELVATKDIGFGDEIFLNYGSEWENAWNDHVSNWRPNEKYKDYVSAAELNARNEDILTRGELKDLEKPLYGSRVDAPVVTACFASSLEQKNKDADEEEPKIYEWKYVDGLFQSGKDRHPCDIIQRNSVVDNANKTTHYTVILNYEQQELFVEGVPREAIRFVDNKYKSDATLRDAFRHEIVLPDDMVPENWRDLLID